MVIVFLPEGSSCRLGLGENLLKGAVRAGLLIDGVCGGEGRCGKCRVRIAAGDGGGEPDQVERELLTEEEIRQGWRLACRLRPISDLTVELLPEGNAGNPKEKMLVFPKDFAPDTENSTKYENLEENLRYLEAENGSKAATGSQAGNGQEALHDLEAENGSEAATGSQAGNEQEAGASVYGIAFDLGTTTVAGMLWNLKDGSFVDGISRSNPQRTWGADVISRIQWWGRSPENQTILRRQAITCLNEILTVLQERNQIVPDQIIKGTLVGNTAMIHLFLGKDPTGLAMAPFHPAFQGAVTFGAGEAELKMKKDGCVYVPPHIGGQVGSDITAVLLSIRLAQLSGANLAVDMGTNGEILLAVDGQVYACSTAAGPAFEGAALYQGMRAERGALESVEIIGGEVKLGVIEGGRPKGICGSGVIDTVAQLLKAGLMDPSGRVREPEEAREMGVSPDLISRLWSKDGAFSFVLDWEETEGGAWEPALMLTQKDIREIQLAKGAIRAGIAALMRRAGIQTAELSKIFLAGAFGIHISPENVLCLNMLPQTSRERIFAVGNGAGAGASMILLSDKERVQAQREAERTIHVELSCEPGFQELFVESMAFSPSVYLG